MTDAIESNTDSEVESNDEWPDNDVDPTTAEGAKIISKSEIALAAHIKKQAEARHQKFRGPTIAYEIPETLYKKAVQQQDQLTEDERVLLSSRGDVVGKALAYPESLTSEERYKVLQWPSPDIVRASIQRATSGRLSTPAELFTKARNAIKRQDLKSLNDRELALIALSFREEDNTPTFSYEYSAWRNVPGNNEATKLIAPKEGVDADTLSKVGMYWLTDPDVSARKATRINQAAAKDQVQRNIVSNTSGIPRQPLQGQDSSSNGEPELLAIADRIEELQQQQDSGVLAKEEFIQQHRNQIAALRTFARKKQYRAHPYSGPVWRVVQPSIPGPVAASPPAAQPPTSLPLTPNALQFHRARRAPFQPRVIVSGPGIVPPDHPIPGVSYLISNLEGSNTHPGNEGVLPPWELTVGTEKAWAPHPIGGILRPMTLFVQDLNAQGRKGFGRDLDALWKALTEEERAAYEAKSEVLRQESWVQHYSK